MFRSARLAAKHLNRRAILRSEALDPFANPLQVMLHSAGIAPYSPFRMCLRQHIQFLPFVYPLTFAHHFHALLSLTAEVELTQLVRTMSLLQTGDNVIRPHRSHSTAIRVLCNCSRMTF